MDLGALVRRLAAGPFGAGGAAAPSGAGSAAPPDSPRDAVSRPAWRDAAPLQRVVGSAPLVAPNAVFAARLAAARPAPLALAPLGHDRGIEAPAGLVSGIAAPVQRAPSSPMPASVRAAHGARPSTTPAVQRSWGGSAWPDDVEAGVPATADSTPAATSVTPEDVPAVAPTGTIAARPAAPGSPLVTAPSPVTGLVGMIGPAAVAAASGSVSTPASSSTAAPPPVVARSLASEADPSGGAGTPATSEARGAAASSSLADRPVRRIRVGAPLTPTVSRLAVPGASPAETSPVASPAAGAPAETSPGPWSAPSHGSPPAYASALDADAGGTSGAHAGVSGAVAGSGGPAASQPSASPAGAPSSSPAVPLPRLQRLAAAVPARSPLVGGLRPVLTPATSAIAVSRRVAAPETESDGDAVGGGSSADALAGLATPNWTASAAWAPGASDSIAAGGGPLGGPSSPFAIEPGQGGISPARLTWTNPLADPSPPSPSADPDTTAAPGLYPRTSGDAPVSAAASTSPSSSAMSASSFPTVSRSVGSRPAAPRGGLRVGPALTATTPGPLGHPAGQAGARPAFRAATPGQASRAWDTEPVVARAVTIDELDVTPESSAASAESGAAAGGTGPAASSGGGAASAPSAAGAAGSEAARDQETQAWADRLYDRISLRLRRDLLVERERAGALVDRGF